MTKKVVKSIVLIFLVLISLSFSLLSLAEDRKLEVKYPEILGLKPETVSIGLPEYVKYVFNLVIILSGFILFGALLWGGIVYLTAGGKSEKLKEGKDRIISAFLGIIILLSSYLILTSINPKLVIFNLPPLTPPKEVEFVEPPEVKPEELNLITLELPLGQAIDQRLFSSKMRKDIKDSSGSARTLVTRLFEIEKEKFEGVAALNKYLESITNECKCDNMTAHCTPPKDCALKAGCTDDPCDQETRKKIGFVLSANRVVVNELTEIQKKILETKASFEKALAKLQEIEQEMLACEQQTKLLSDLNEHLSRMNYYNEQGWELETVYLPGAPRSLGDALTFYCSAGGNILDYPYAPKTEIPPEFLGVPGTEISEMPSELTSFEEISCPAEIPIGQIVDRLREKAVSLIVKLERLDALSDGKTDKLASLKSDEYGELDGGLSFQLSKMDELVAKCSGQSCKIECSCVPHIPCGVTCALGPAQKVICRIPCFPTPWGCIPNPCYQQCSPCLQAVGGCTGIPCPRDDIKKTALKIKKIESEVVKTVREIDGLLGEVAALLGEDPEEPWNLKNFRQALRLCYSPSVEEPTWELLNCEAATGNYGPDGRIIGDCHPRNFFCCSLSEEKIAFPWKPPAPPKELVFTVPTKKYEPLPEGEKGCPQGWLCDQDVKNYNQYNDASQSLKELLSCMRERLDKTKAEQELEQTLGRISSISDSKLYKGTCSWKAGPSQPGGCSHIYENLKYGKERVSAHYGGTICRIEEKSYAFDLGDEENADYLIAAAKECRPDAWTSFRTPGHYDHLHISIGQAEDCGGN